MRSIHKSTLFILILVSSMVFANDDEIEKEILDYEDTDLIILLKSRKMVLDNIENGNIEKVREIQNFLLRKYDGNNVVPFWQDEEWLLFYWTRDYQVILKNIKNYAPKVSGYYSDKLVPADDMFLPRLLNITDSNKQVILNVIKRTNLERKEKEFLYLFLDYLLVEKEQKYVTYKELNDNATEYLNFYPDSEYNGFIRQYIRYVYVTSKKGWGFNFSTGYGQFTDNLKNYYSDNWGAGIGFCLELDKVIMYTKIFGGFTKIKREFYYHGVWEDGLKMEYIIPELSFGYELIDNRKIKISPYAGISGFSIYIPDTDHVKHADDVKVNSYLTGVYGIDFMYKLAITQGNNYDHTESTWFINLRLGATNPRLKNKIDGFSGNIYFIELGLGVIGKKIVRDY